MADYLSLGYIIGYIGNFLGLCVPIPQLYKILKTRSLNDISLGTYSLLIGALICYLIHALYIGSIVFTIAQSVNLSTNGIIWVLLLLDRMRGRNGIKKTT